MDSGSLGKYIILFGIGAVVFGAIVLLVSQVSGGRGAPLPGDIAVRWKGVRVYFPIVSSIVVSIVLTLIFWLVARLRR